MSRSHFSGSVVETSRAAEERRDCRIFIPACNSTVVGVAGAQGTWTPTRVAANQWSMRRTAAAATHIYAFEINSGMLVSNPAQTVAEQARLGEVPRGPQINRLDLVYGIGTANLTTHTATLNRVSFANAVAPTITAVTMTGSLATATNAQPQLSQLSPTAAPVIGANELLVLEVSVQDPGTSVYDAYGLYINFNLLL